MNFSTTFTGITNFGNIFQWKNALNHSNDKNIYRTIEVISGKLLLSIVNENLLYQRRNFSVAHKSNVTMEYISEVEENVSKYKASNECFSWENK